MKLQNHSITSEHQSATENPRDYLTDYSPGDAPWDAHRGQVDDVGGIYAQAAGFERYASRMAECSGVLRFGWSIDSETGESRLRLREAQFCRVRYCPVCQWRRALMWRARFYQSIPTILEKYPNARWLFLTLTVRNCAIDELGATLTAMNEGWQRLIKRREFAPVLGWVRATEVTRGQDGTAHPHFHVLLMVPPGMVSGRHYVKQSRWTDIWRDCMRLDYSPVVDIRVVKSKGQEDVSNALRAGITETLKYSVKPDDMTDDEQWFLELTRQCHRRRFIATGGVLKDILRVDDETDADLALVDGDADGDDDARLSFGWRVTDRRYRRKKT